MIRSIYIIVIFIGIVGCHNNNKQIPVETVLSAHTILTEFSDSSFVPMRITCIDICNDNFYCTDYSGGYLVLDKELTLLKRIGSRGAGPEEFLGAAHFCIQNEDSLYVLNEGKHSIELFVSDKHTKRIPFPQGLTLTFATRFFVENQQIYHSVIADSLPIAVFDNESHTNKYVGQFTKEDNINLKRHSTRHIIKGEHNFFVIGSILPIFQKYDFNGKLLENYDMENLPKIKRNVTRYKTQEQIPTSYFTMCQDTFYDKEKVFLLVASNENNDYLCNTVYVLNTEDNIKHIATYVLSAGEVYGTFCVKQDTLLAYNSMNVSLDMYILPESK